MKDNRKSWGMFCKDKYWTDRKDKPDVDQIENVEFSILKYVLGDDRNSQKNASFYNEAITALLIAKVPRQNIANEIEKRGGLRKIVDRHRKEMEPSGDHSKVTPPVRSQGAVKKGASKSSARSVGESSKCVEFTTTQAQFNDIMALKEGDVLNVCLECTKIRADNSAELRAFEVIALAA